MTNTNSLFINLDNLKVDHLEQLHLDVWTPDAEIFSIYLSDGVLETPAIKMASIEQRWNSLDILLSDYQKYINMANLYSIRLESNKPGAYYIDNLYFYSSPATDNSAIQQVNDITCRIINNQLFVESQTPLRSVIISDVSGRINSNIKVNGTTAVTIDLNLMSNGVYFLRAVCSDGKIKTTKFLKR